MLQKAIWDFLEMRKLLQEQMRLDILEVSLEMVKEELSGIIGTVQNGSVELKEDSTRFGENFAEITESIKISILR